MAFTIADLNIAAEELQQIQTRLVTLRNPGALATVMSEQEQRVTDYTAAYSVPTSTVKRLVRQLVLWELYFLIGMASDSRRKAYEDTTRELEAIRDGKMPYEAAGSPPVSAVSGGAWGSKPDILA